MFERSHLIDRADQDNGEAGITIGDVGRSIMIWASMNYGGPLTVSECAVTFNTSVDVVREAVRENSWAFLSPDDESDPAIQVIEVDGE